MGRIAMITRTGLGGRAYLGGEGSSGIGPGSACPGGGPLRRASASDGRAAKNASSASSTALNACFASAAPTWPGAGRRYEEWKSPGRRRAEAGVCGSAISGHRQFAQQGPVILRDGHIDDPRRARQVGWQRALGVLEVLGLDVRVAGLTVAECLDQHVLGRVRQASGPVE